MKISKQLPTFAINVLCLILLLIQLVYTMSVHGFSHIDTRFILNTIFSVSLFLLAILATIFVIALTISLYILKKIGVLENKFKNVANIIIDKVSNTKQNT